MLLNQLTNLLDKSVQPGTFFIDNWSAFHQCHERSLGVFYSNCSSALATFYYDLYLSVFLLLRLQNATESSHSIDLVRRGLVNGSIVLSSKIDSPVCSQGLFQRPN